MKNLIPLAIAFLFIVSCSSKKVMNSGEAKEQLQSEWSNRIGSAVKADLVQTFGNAEWCRESEGGEECRFYRKIGNRWVGEDKKDKKSYVAFDEVIAKFDKEGILTSLKANAQR